MRTIFDQLRDPAVRDLYQACFGPELLPALTTAPRLHWQEGDGDWFLRLDNQPQLLHDFIATRPCQRLGVYLECLWQFLLQQHPNYQLIGHNLPVYEGKRTLGELDIVYRDLQQEQFVHLEIAVKFYLAVPDQDATRLSSWWGPNSKDQLQRKYNRLCDHQLPLSATTQGRTMLGSMGIKSCQRQWAVRGRLFIAPAESAGLPTAVADNATVHHWYYLSQFEVPAAVDSWCILSRQQWLSPQYLSTGQGSDFADIHQQLTAATRPKMIAGFDSEGNEIERYFICPSDWPAQTVA